MSDEQPESDLPPRPRTRGDCERGERPCPYVSCAHHLYLDVHRSGGVRMTHPHLEPWELPETCALDVADRGGLTLEEVSEVMNVTRERIRQIEATALTRIRSAARKVLSDDLPPPRRVPPPVSPTPAPRRLPLLATAVAPARVTPPPSPLRPAAQPTPVAAAVEPARERPSAPAMRPAPITPSRPAAAPSRPVKTPPVSAAAPGRQAQPEPPRQARTPAEIQAARVAEMRPLKPPTRKPAGDDAWPLWERA